MSTDSMDRITPPQSPTGIRPDQKQKQKRGKTPEKKKGADGSLPKKDKGGREYSIDVVA